MPNSTADKTVALYEESPETSRRYHCTTCDNQIAFVGIDAHGWGGADSCDGDCENECTCETELVQSFTVNDAESNDIDYDAFDGGDGAEIGAYTRVLCRKCGQLLWAET